MSNLEPLSLDEVAASVQQNSLRSRINRSTAGLAYCNEIAMKILSPKNKSVLEIEVPENSRHDFYQKFQTIGKQRQINQVSKEDPSKLMVVHEAYDESVILGSPNTASAAKNTLRRLRSRTLPEFIGSSPDKINIKNKFEDDIKLDGNAAASSNSDAGLASPNGARATRRQRFSIHKQEVVGTAMEANLSPRSKYIEGCMREGLNPRAALVLKRKTNKELLLAHQVSSSFSVDMCDLFILNRVWGIRWLDYLQNQLLGCQM